MNMLKRTIEELKPFVPGALIAAAIVLVPLAVEFLHGAHS